ncbi:MAG: arginine--tRNA ligase [Pseudomonadota bacterium]
MNVFQDIRAQVIGALDTMVEAGDLPAGLPFAGVTVEPPRDPAHGDLATNAAMVLAKPAQSKPRDIAERLAEALRAAPEISSADVAGPGFLNLRLASDVWRRVVPAVLEAGTDFGQGALGHRGRVNVEYVSANPTGPLHVGHTRGAVFGDALARLLAFAGWDVTREYYINDGGSQVDTLARSVYARYLEAHGRALELPAGGYPGDYLTPVGNALKEEVGEAYVDQPEEIWLGPVRSFATDAMMDLIRNDLRALGVEMDMFFSEKSLYTSGRIEGAIADLKAKDLIYDGKLPPPKGKTPEDWEPREQTLFRSTARGDDQDRAVKKSDGSWTYFAPDIAYHFDKVERGYDQLINVFGRDHNGYVSRLKAAVSALSDGQVPLDIKLINLVKLFKDGEEYKMSKRAGTFVMLRDVLDEVGPDVTRFHMLTRKNDAPLDFDFDKALEQSRENPVFYVQYAHARIASVLRKAPGELPPADLAHLTHETEQGLIRKVAEWPRTVEGAADAHEPHRVAFYLYDLASAFHAYQHLGKMDPALRFLRDDAAEVTAARLALIRAVQLVIAAGLGILGVTPAREM